MTENNRHLTFSQRNGLAPIPQPLKLGYISDEFRKTCWNLFYLIIFDGQKKTSLENKSRYYNKKSGHFINQSLAEFFKESIDETPKWTKYCEKKYKNLFLSEEYDKILDFIEYILRIFPQLFSIDPFLNIFKKNLLAYTIVDEKCPTIVPAATPEEGETIRQAFEAAKEDKYEPVRKHLRKSAERINANQPADAMRESIHAVESVLRIVTDEKDFNKALQKFKTSHRIHKALKGAFEKLYGYTSDEPGIRHGLGDQPESPAGMDEAVFMLGTCAAFVGYVIRKSPALGAVAAPGEG